MTGKTTETQRRKEGPLKWVWIAALLCAVVSLWFYPSFAQQTLKVDVNLVSIFATVKDESGNFVSGLTRDDFRVYEDDRLQDVQIFEKERPVDSAIGILMDTSGSMVDILPFMRRGIRDFTRALPKGDEFFVGSFGTSVRLIHVSTQSQGRLEDRLAGLRAYGTSVMYDGLLWAMQRLEGSEHPRKALIVFTDGNDNGSNFGYGRVVEEAQQSAVLLYFVAIGSPILVDSHTIGALSDISGGRTLYVAKQEPVSPVLDQIRAELAQQYYLGYYVARRSGFHRLRVEVPGRNVKVRAKFGYSSD